MSAGHHQRSVWRATPGLLCSLLLVLGPLASRSAADAVANPRAVAAAVPAAPFGDGSPYPGPNPPSIPAAGGIIQAANFNSGPAEQAFHGCTPGDQGPAALYRPDPHDIDIYQAGPSSFYVQSSSPHPSADPTHNCPVTSHFFSDYVKYSFTVDQTGWYTISGVGQLGAFWTLVDDIDKGQTASVGSWSNVVLAPAVHLVAGATHVLTIDLLGFGTDLATIDISPTTATFPLPRVVSAPLTTNEVVIADAVVTDQRFGAVANNAAVDNRAPIQSTLNIVGKEGGGTVFIPPGLYTVKGGLSIPANVTLRGDWSANTSKAGQTILAARVPTGAMSAPLISLSGTNSAVSHLSVWYPNQSFSHPSHFPPTIRSFVPSVSVNDVTLYNSDQGVVYRYGSTSDISGLRATCLTTCIIDDQDLDFSFITNVKISNQVWETAPAQVKRKPTTAKNRAALNRWTGHHLTAVHLYRNDNLTVYGVTVSNAALGIVTTAIELQAELRHLRIVLEDLGEPQSQWRQPDGPSGAGVNSIMDTDLVSQARKIAYRFAPARMPARTGPTAFYNVMAAPFFAHADGITDDTQIIQNAIDTASAAGGGTVYLPSGTYLVATHLVVRPGVELRGAYSNRHTSETPDSTTLLAVEGQGTAYPNTDPAFISLSPHSGLRGVTIRYPNQGFGSAAYPVTPYPFTIRSLGEGTWLQDTNVLNGYQIADLTTYPSNGFVVKNLWATAFLSGVSIGGGSTGGWLERSVISYGDLYESRHDNSPHSYGLNAIMQYTSNHVVAYYIGDANAVQSLGAMSFNDLMHLVAYQATVSSTGPINSTFFAASSDSANSAGFDFRAGNQLSYIGLLSRSPYTHNNVQTANSFHGVSSIDDGALSGNGPGTGVVRQGGTLRVYPENLRSPHVSG